MKISKLQARLFLLEYQKLLNPKSIDGKDGIMSFIKQVGSIQFDPLSIIDINPNLVLQSRIKAYEAEYLQGLLYKDRKLVDDWDKNMCIYPVEDWPYFQRYREKRFRLYSKFDVSEHQILDEIRKVIREKGPISSRELNYKEKVDWFWNDSNIGKVALESMYFCGELIIHHKEGIRKYYDFSKNYLPKSITEMKDPNENLEDFFEWIVKRRIGSVGLLWNKRSDAFLGISIKSTERNEATKQLVKKNELIEVFVEDIAYPFYLRNSDYKILEEVIAGIEYEEKVSFIAPLDNLIWDRELIKVLFNFEYTWEVYKPASERIYGYYVLPVLYGDKFIARFEPRYDKKQKVLTILNWWYEDGVVINQEMINEIYKAILEFSEYLNAIKVDWLCSIEK